MGMSYSPEKRKEALRRDWGKTKKPKNKKQKMTGDRKDKMSKESSSRKVKKVAVITEETRRGRGSWQEQNIQ